MLRKSSCAVIFQGLYIFPQRNNLLSYLNTFELYCKCKYFDYLIGPEIFLKEPGLKEFENIGNDIIHRKAHEFYMFSKS